MPKRSSHEIKKKILLAIKEKPATYAQLERRVNTGYRSIKANCEELKYFDQVLIEEKQHPANGKLSYSISITPRGLKTIEEE